MEIKDISVEQIIAKSGDYLALQDPDTGIGYKIKKRNFVSGLGGGSTASLWDTTTNSQTISTFPAKILVTSTQATIDIAPNPPLGSEIEIKLLLESANVSLTNITVLNGIAVPSNGVVKVLYSLNSSARLIYVSPTYGWLVVPKNLISAFVPLNLPTDGLIQKFYAGDITGIPNSGLVAEWIDTISGKNATQSSQSSQPTFNSNVFNSLPSVYFDGNRYFSTDLNYLSGIKYTIAVVEARTSVNNNTNYFLGFDAASTNQALHLGYRSNTTITLAQFSNDLNSEVIGYSGIFKPNIWVFSNNSRGKEIWLNGVKIASSQDTTNLSSASNGRLGRAVNSNCICHLGLVAIYSGEKSVTDIGSIFNAINNLFNIY